MNVFEHRKTVGAPLDALLRTLLGDLPRLAPLMPNVERIEPLSACWVLGRLTRRDRWVGRPTSAVARWLLPSEAVTWVVRSFWQLEPCVISWELEPTRRPLRVEGSGEVRLSQAPEQGTRVDLDGTLAIDGPGLLAYRHRSVEALLAGLLQRNLLCLFERAERALVSPLAATAAFGGPGFGGGARGGQLA
jgi:uncharacterized membrane protein